MTPGAPVAGAEPLGLALGGWKAPRGVPITPEVEQVLAGLQGSDQSLETRGYALAARLVAGANAPLAPAMWQEVRDLVGQVRLSKVYSGQSAPSGEVEGARAAMLVLVVAAARVAPAQRPAFTPDLRAMIETLTPPPGAPTSMPRDKAFAERLGLLWPSRAIERSGFENLPAPFIEDWIFGLRQVRPDLSLSATTRLIRQNKNNAFAWFLPQLREVAPKLYTAVLDFNARDPKNARLVTSGFDNIRPEMVNKAVYRLASVAPTDAARFFALLQEPRMRIEAAQFLAEDGNAYAPSVDAEFEKAITVFQPSRSEQTAARLLVERARYHERWGKTATAGEFLGQAMQLAAGDFGAARTVYYFLRDQGDPRAAGWLEKLKATALETDRGQNEGGGGIYFSATYIVVSELARLGQFDAALALAQTLNPITFPSNRSLAFSSIAYAVAATDAERALQIAQSVDETRRTDVFVGIALRVARTDFARGWAMLERVAPESKAAAVWQFAPYAPAAFAPELRALMAQSIETKIARPEHLRDSMAGRNPSDLEKSAPALLASLAPSFAGDRALLARDLFLSLGDRACAPGDPLWQRLRATETVTVYSIEWAPSSLKGVRTSVAANAERGLDFDKVELSGGNWE